MKDRGTWRGLRVVIVAAAIVATAACGGGAPAQDRLNEIGFPHADVTETVRGGRVTVIVATEEGPADPTAPRAAARAVWELHPTRVDRVIVRSPGGSASFDRGELLVMFGPRDPALDAKMPDQDGFPGAIPMWWLLVAGAVVLGGCAVVVARRLARSEAGLHGVIVTDDGLVFAGTRSTGLGPEADVGVRPADPSWFGVGDVLDLLALFATSGMRRNSVLLAGRWGVRAWSGHGPDVLPVLDLFIDEGSLTEALGHLGGVGYSVDWNRRADQRLLVLRDRQGRMIRVTSMVVVEDGTAGGRSTATAVPRSRLGSGQMGGIPVPCLVPEAAPVA